jgi:lipoprotein NlpD
MTTLVLACVLAACAAPAPAPVVNRTKPPPSVARPAPPKPEVRAAAPQAPTVESAPVRSSGVQVRPLTTPAPGPALPPAMVRTEPRGGKLPYSDLALAELRTGDASGPVAGSQAPAPVASVSPRPEPRAAVSASEFEWPARGKVIQGFAEPRSMGISIDGKLGDPVVAAAGGKVIFSGPGPRGYGNLLIVKHDADTLSVYAHNRALLVKEGETVKRGQRIAELGESGTDRPKLHFEIRKAGKPVDPQKLLPAR